MKTSRKICTTKCEYQLPDVEVTNVIVEHGYVASIEFVDKDEEVEF